MKIHQVKGRHVNSYVIEDGDDLLVVDAAWRGEKYVLGYIHKVLQRDIRDVKLVICTHGDPDHSGSVAKIASVCGAQLAVPYATPSSLDELPCGLNITHCSRALKVGRCFTRRGILDSGCFYYRPSGSLITGDTLPGSNNEGRPVQPWSTPIQCNWHAVSHYCGRLSPRRFIRGTGPVLVVQACLIISSEVGSKKNV